MWFLLAGAAFGASVDRGLQARVFPPAFDFAAQEVRETPISIGPKEIVTEFECYFEVDVTNFNMIMSVEDISVVLEEGQISVDIDFGTVIGYDIVIAAHSGWLDLCLDLGEGTASLTALPLLQMALTLAGAGTPVEPGPLPRLDSREVFVGVAHPVEIADEETPDEDEDEERPAPSPALTAPTRSLLGTVPSPGWKPPVIVSASTSAFSSAALSMSTTGRPTPVASTTSVLSCSGTPANQFVRSAMIAGYDVPSCHR